jgi:hypothetical protein
MPIMFHHSYGSFGKGDSLLEKGNSRHPAGGRNAHISCICAESGHEIIISLESGKSIAAIKHKCSNVYL